MPRNVSTDLKAAIEAESGRFALLVKITPNGASALGFTSWTEPITYSGLIYQPQEGVELSNVRSVIGSGVDNSEVSGALAALRIDDNLIRSGRIEGARIWIAEVNVDDLAAGALVYQDAVIGELTQGQFGFKAEVRGLTHILKQPVGTKVSKQCRCFKLGDAECGLNMAGDASQGGSSYAIRATKTLASGSGINLTFGSTTMPTGFYDFGLVSFSSGANAGLTREVKTHTLSSGTAVLVLRDPFPFAVAAGDQATLEAGCDRLFPSCRDKFANANRFRGEPDIPGNDVFTKRLRQK